jgi:hypothetical protein
MKTRMRARGLLGTAARTAAVLLAVWAGAAMASEGEVVISGAAPAKRKAVSPVGGRALLFGPVKLTQALKETKGVISVHLEGVTFDPTTGNESQLYVVDAKGTAKALRIDPVNYVGSAANVAGGTVGTADMSLEINDFEVAGKAMKAKTNFQAMDEVFLALVVTRGELRFRRAVLSAEPPPSKEAAPKAP